MKYEQFEQYFVSKWIKPDDVVLEIGARYGAVSSCINILLKNRENHVAIEPDPHALPILKKNRKITKSKFKICNMILGNEPVRMAFTEFGLDSGVVTNNDKNTKLVQNITVQNFFDKYKLNFNVLIVDCEGCLCKLFEEDGDLLLLNIKLVLFEQDAEEICNYDIITNKLKELGFVLIDKITLKRKDYTDYSFQQVWNR